MPRARCMVESRLLEELGRRGLEPSMGLAVAYSGGPDSTALLAALSALCGRGESARARPLAIHVDHGLRPEAELEAELALVAENCRALGARLLVAHVRRGAIAERARASGEGVEAAARRYRYSAFRRGLSDSGCRALLLAHTADDQLETVLMRLFGGSGSGGLRGIPASSGPFLRPFLGLAKADLLSYLEERGLRYSIDSTNAQGDYLRNRIRGELVPFLDSGFPGWRRGLARAAAKAGLDEDALSRAAASLRFERLADGSLSAPAASLLSAPDALALRALVEASSLLRGKARMPSDLAAAALRALRMGEGASYRGSGILFSRRSDRVELRFGLDFPRARGYFVMIDRPQSLRIGGLEVRAAWSDADRASERGQGIRADAFRFPLVVRSRRPGDGIALPGGTKRLDALFSEWALQEEARRRVPVIEDRDGIVAVLGSSLGGEDRYRRGPSGSCDRRLVVSVKGA